MKNGIKKDEYKDFFLKIKEKILASQYNALKAVNKELLKLYWDIGKAIIHKQKQSGWGKSIVVNLANDLQKEFPGIKGFSTDNLWRMRKFYLKYFKNKKLAPMVQEISWSKNIILMEKCKDELQIEFYIKMTKELGWTKNVLIHNIETKYYEKFLLNQNNFGETLPQKYRNQAKLALKDEYTFNFLELNAEHSEKELENAIINKIRNFLIEMGNFFTFIGNQYRIEINDKEYFIDLLLYHRKLKSLILIDLKIGEFKPEYAGKMQFYLSLIDDKIKLEDENPSIGIIICKSKDRTIVEYTLKNTNAPIGVSTYKITHTVPKGMKNLLPNPDEIKKQLEYLDEYFKR